MKCGHVRAVLQDHVERQLLPIDRADVRIHLETCAPCAVEEARLRAVIDALQHLPDAEVPASFKAEVMDRLPEMLPANHGTGHLLRWGAVAAALVFAFLVSLSLLIEGGGPDVARETLEPLAASVELAVAMLAHGTAAAAALLDASSTAIAHASLGAKLAFALAFAASHAAFFVLVARTRPQLGHAPARVHRR